MKLDSAFSDFTFGEFDRISFCLSDNYIMFAFSDDVFNILLDFLLFYLELLILCDKFDCNSSCTSFCFSTSEFKMLSLFWLLTFLFDLYDKDAF